MNIHDFMLGAMRLLPEVHWDRWAGGEEHASAFGWLIRPDGARDFVVLLFGDDFQLGMVTSSAHFSETFAGRLGLPHSNCKLIKDSFPHLNYA